MKAVTTRAEIVSRLYEHVWENGHTATSIGDIAGKAGILKGSFYNYFTDKADFTDAILEKYAQEWSAFMRNQLLSPEPMKARFKHLFAALRRRYRDESFLLRGCLAGNLCQERARNDKGFAERVEKVFALVELIIHAALQAGQKEGSLPKRANIDQISRFILNSLQGALLRMKSVRSVLPLNDLEAHLEAFVFQKKKQNVGKTGSPKRSTKRARA
ncbi:MAG: TetR family transcriptional regulator C-terminal domain-containing protein [Leptospirales bacterium]|nr:TetR family transcriptional regulator C-terminal domain-containing protein [Leptospirales bacterium]